jgi:hypothetical protein
MDAIGVHHVEHDKSNSKSKILQNFAQMWNLDLK